jgi:hypothetical protein
MLRAHTYAVPAPLANSAADAEPLAETATPFLILVSLQHRPLAVPDQMPAVKCHPRPNRRIGRLSLLGSQAAAPRTRRIRGKPQI